MAFPNPDGQYILDTDASGFAIGAVLSQLQDGEEKVIAYASRVLNQAERNYCVTRRELLSIVEYVRHFKTYIYGRHVEVRTDHASLVWIRRFKEPSGQLYRWLEILEEQDYTIKVRPGRKHSNADALSRYMCNGKGCMCKQTADLADPSPPPEIDVACNLHEARNSGGTESII